MDHLNVKNFEQTALPGVVALRAAYQTRPNLRVAIEPDDVSNDTSEMNPATELLRAIVDTSPFATMAFDRNRNIVFWSPAAEQIFGWRADEVIGHPFPQEAIPPEDRSSSAARISRTLAGAIVRGDLVKRLTRDGREVLVEIHGSVLRGRHGQPIGYAGQMIDVTEREQSLHEREDLAAALELDLRLRSVLVGAVQRLAPDATLEAAAQAICAQLRELPAVDFAALGVFTGEDGAHMLASDAPPGFPLKPGDDLPEHRARRIWERSSLGPWAEYWESMPEDGGWGLQLDAAGLRAFAFGPIVHGDHTDGGVVIGTRDEAFARMLVERMPTAVDFSSTPSALLAERLHARRSEIELQRNLSDVLSARRFRPVFQPIVDLASGETVGHEALTRFESGQRPDHVFADAWSVGLGAEFELVTVAAAVQAARELPAGLWLDVNVSPSLLVDDRTRLAQIFAEADRPIVLEITEHDIVADYGALREAVRSLGEHIRLAVDDAGAGVANFSHIIELGPDFVKLDTSLVRGVNANLGRQALVVGMRHFARTAGCRLVAEGVETKAEAKTLAQLGVEFGQGHWFGRPLPAPGRARA